MGQDAGAASHQHRYFTEQQTGHRYCYCGRHDPPNARCPDLPSGLWRMLNDEQFQRLHQVLLARRKP